MNFQRVKNCVGFTIIQIVLMILFSSCSSKEVDPNNVEALYQDAEETFQDGRYLSAIEKYRDIKNRFPYSSRAMDAELRIADSYFEQESFIEAESSYEIFKELHPKHPKSDYVQYRIGLSSYNDIPDNIARDLTAAHKAISAFELLIEKYPQSEHLPKVREFLVECRKKLAEHEQYVADFYYRREHFLSASYRYATLLKEYPNLGYDEEALYRMGKCYYNIRMYSNARDTLKKLISHFPNGPYSKESEGLINQLGKTQ